MFVCLFWGLFVYVLCLFPESRMKLCVNVNVLWHFLVFSAPAWRLGF